MTNYKTAIILCISSGVVLCSSALLIPSSRFRFSRPGPTTTSTTTTSTTTTTQQLTRVSPNNIHQFLGRHNINTEFHWNQRFGSVLIPFVATTSLHVTAISNNDVTFLEDDDNDNESETGDINEDDDNNNALMTRIAQILDTTPLGELSDDMLLDQTCQIANDLMGSSTTETKITKERIETIEMMLWRIVDEKEAGNGRAKPTTELFNLAMEAWAAYGKKISSKRAHSILFKMDDMYNAGNDRTIKPNIISFNTALKATAKCRERGSDKRAWSIFHRLQQLQNSSGPEDDELQPNVDTYIYLIDSLAQGRSWGAARHSEEMLREAVRLFGTSNETIGVRSFNKVLTAWSKSDEEEAPERASEILTWMAERSNTAGDEHMKPDVFSFTAVIDTFAQKNSWEGANRAEGILNQMVDLYLAGVSDIEPDIVCFTIVISAYSRLAKKGSRDAAKRAYRLLRRMEQLHELGKMNTKPDSVSYFTCLNAWAYTKQSGAAESAEEILDKMESLYRAGDDETKPSPLSFRMVIEAYAKSQASDAMDRAESVLDRMEAFFDEDIPDAKAVYGIIINGWAQRKNPSKADDFLRRMLRRNVIPDSFCFDKVIETWTRSDHPHSFQNAAAIFELAEKTLQTPNERFFTTFIRAIAKGGDDTGKAEQAQTILRKMQDCARSGNADAKPTIYAYNAVLNACASTEGDDDEELSKAFEIAIVTFNELRKSKERPDSLTYSTLLKACSALLPDEGEKRRNVARATFKKCCQDGLMNEHVIDELKLALPNEWDKLVRCQDSDECLTELPEEWSRNVRTNHIVRSNSFVSSGFRSKG